MHKSYASRGCWLEGSRPPRRNPIHEVQPEKQDWRKSRALRISKDQNREGTNGVQGRYSWAQEHKLHPPQRCQPREGESPEWGMATGSAPPHPLLPCPHTPLTCCCVCAWNWLEGPWNALRGGFQMELESALWTHSAGHMGKHMGGTTGKSNCAKLGIRGSLQGLCGSNGRSVKQAEGAAGALQRDFWAPVSLQPAHTNPTHMGGHWEGESGRSYD